MKKQPLVLTKAQLQEKITDLEKALNYRDDYLHMVVHDIRNPINQLKLIASNELTEEEKLQLMPLVSRKVSQIDTIINELVEVVKIHTGETSIKTFNINESITQTIEKVKGNFNGEAIIIEKDIEAGSNITYEPRFFESIVKNLVSNAIKYSQQDGKPEIKLTVAKNHGYCCLKVQDNGIGIDLDKHGDEIFKPFHRVSRNIKGLGVGLHITKTIVERNGGYMEVESMLTEGTTFSAYLKEYA